MEVILDASFIVSCVKRNIDFITELQDQGFKVLLPREVYQELKDLRLKVPHDERMAVDLALEILEAKKVKKTTIGKASVDHGLISLGKKGAYIATLDRAIKREVPNRISISDAKNSILVERS